MGPQIPKIGLMVTKQISNKQPMQVAMLSYSFYESDNRVRRYAESLVQRGDSVDVISLRRQGQGDYNELNGVKIYRIQERARDEKGKIDYFKRIFKFFIHSAELLARRHISHPYDMVHVHSVPDFEVFAALFPKLSGASVILDIHDIVPELYCNKFKIHHGSLIFKVLAWIEKLSIGFSDQVIISNEIWRERLVSRSVSANKCIAILNYPDTRLFGKARSGFKDKEKTVFLYPGTLNHHQGLDIAIEAFSKIRDLAPNTEFHIYGDGPAKPGLMELTQKLGLIDRVFLHDPVPLDEIACIMAKADIGVIPKKNDSFGGEAFSTKTLEFMILGVPIILSRTRIDQMYFDESTVKFFKADSVEELASAMLEMVQNPELRERLARLGQEFARKNRWEIKKDIYMELVDKLMKKKGKGKMRRFTAHTNRS